MEIKETDSVILLLLGVDVVMRFNIGIVWSSSFLMHFAGISSTFEAFCFCFGGQLDSASNFIGVNSISDSVS